MGGIGCGHQGLRQLCGADRGLPIKVWAGVKEALPCPLLRHGSLGRGRCTVWAGRSSLMHGWGLGGA